MSAALVLVGATLFFSARDANHDRAEFKKQAKATNDRLGALTRENTALRSFIESKGFDLRTVVIPGPAGTRGPAGPAGSGGPVTPSSSQPPGPPGPTTTSTTSTTSTSSTSTTTTTPTRPPLVTLPTLPRPPLRAR